MTTDPITSMTASEIKQACEQILDVSCSNEANLVGLMIARLQEWEFSFNYSSLTKKWGVGRNCIEISLQCAFLRVALESDKWSPPKPKEPEASYWIDGKGTVYTATGAALGFSAGSEVCKRVRVTEWKE